MKIRELLDEKRLIEWNKSLEQNSVKRKLNPLEINLIKKASKGILKGILYGAIGLGSLSILEKGCERDDVYEQQKEQYIKENYPKEPYHITKRKCTIWELIEEE